MNRRDNKLVTDRFVAAALVAAGMIVALGQPFLGNGGVVLGCFLIGNGAWLLFSPLSHRWASIGLSLAAASGFFVVWPDVPLPDDAAIVLKYMDNFARGYFYCYNPQDGPVFGVSGFVHGIVAGTFAYTHLFTPLESLYASNFLGVVAVCYLSFRILEWHVGENNSLLVPFWALLLLTADLFIVNAKSGLETPLHLAFVLASLLLYLQNNTKMLLLFCVVTIISKLDAVPVVGVLFIANGVRNAGNFRSASFRKEYWRLLLLFGAMPLILWLAVSTSIFGSPLPQTAYAKLLFHRSTSQHWFPFLESLFNDKHHLLLVVALLCCALYVGTLVYFLKEQQIDFVLTTFVYGAMIVAYVMLYGVYNPAERMGWYYVVPAFLLAMQGIVLVYEFLLKKVERYGTAIGAAAMICYLVFYLPRLEAFVERFAFKLCLVENERKAIGQWVKEHSVATDTLLTGFGHIAQRAGLYTIDYSGLNSRIATNLRVDIPTIVLQCTPQWIVLDTLLSNRSNAHRHYELRHSYFNLASVGKETWRVYERGVDSSDKRDLLLAENMVVSHGRVIPSGDGGISCTGRTILLSNFGESIHAQAFVVGLTKRAVDLSVTASFKSQDGTELARHSIRLEKQKAGSFVDGYTIEWLIPLSKEWDVFALTITVVEPQAEELEILSPTFVNVLSRNS